MKPMPGQRSVNKYYPLIGWSFGLWRAMGKGSTLQDVAQAMINCVTLGSEKKVLEVADINALAQRR